MKKLILLFAALCCMAVANAQGTISATYVNANGQEQPSVTATVVTSSDNQVEWTEGWYVVTGNDVTISGGVICSGDVHLILADGAKLTATVADDRPGIEVTNGNALTIYGQNNQSGCLEVTGGYGCAGIGGGYLIDGSNIIINGGKVTATGDEAGIGGGSNGSGYNITINGGTVTATGNDGAGIGGGEHAAGYNITINGGTVTAKSLAGGAGIGGGGDGFGYNIHVKASCHLYADGILILHRSDEDLADKLKVPNVFIGLNPELLELIAEAKDAIDDAVSGITNQSILDVAEVIKEDIDNAATPKDVSWAKELGLAKIADCLEIDAATNGITNQDILDIVQTIMMDIAGATTEEAVSDAKESGLNYLKPAVKLYNSGKADALGTLGIEQNGPALRVTDKDGKQVILYSPKSVEYIKASPQTPLQ